MNAYYEYWDEFIRQWFHNQTPGQTRDQARPWGDENHVSRAFFATGSLDFDELPEPYLGRPDQGVKAVIININPGGAQSNAVRNLEDTKRFSLLRNGAWLLERFRDEFECLYSRYSAPDAYSCLNPALTRYNGTDREVCGVRWWQRPGGPLNWMSRIYNDPGIGPHDVFAIEFCPFHSRRQRFNLDGLIENGVPPEWFTDHVIRPACVAARLGQLPFVVGVGRIVADALDRLQYTCWRTYSDEDNIPNWPLRGDGNRIRRTYRIYNVEGVPFVITWAPGGNTCPAEQFCLVEGAVRREIMESFPNL